jgi:hypothetical protein
MLDELGIKKTDLDNLDDITLSKEEVDNLKKISLAKEYIEKNPNLDLHDLPSPTPQTPITAIRIPPVYYGPITPLENL